MGTGTGSAQGGAVQRHSEQSGTLDLSHTCVWTPAVDLGRRQLSGCRLPAAYHQGEINGIKQAVNVRVADGLHELHDGPTHVVALPMWEQSPRGAIPSSCMGRAA